MDIWGGAIPGDDDCPLLQADPKRYDLQRQAMCWVSLNAGIRSLNLISWQTLFLQQP